MLSQSNATKYTKQLLLEYNVPATIVEHFTEKSLKNGGDYRALRLWGTFRKFCNGQSLEIIYNPNALQKYFLQIPEKYRQKYSSIFIVRSKILNHVKNVINHVNRYMFLTMYIR